MQINTTRFGDIDVDDAKVITFTQGPIGFSYARDYVRLSNQLGENTPFRWLQATAYPDMAFVIVDPLTFLPDYRIDVNRNELADLEPENPEDVRVYCVVVIPEKVHDMTANLRAPVLVNERNLKAKQIILNDTRLPLRFPIMHEMENRVAQLKEQGAAS